jgi:hypothetical protein
MREGGWQMGVFFERADTGTDPVEQAVEDALRVDPATVRDPASDAKRRTAAAKGAKASSPVTVKTRNLVIALALTAVFLVVAVVLANVVDPMLIAQAEKKVATPGYTPPDLQLKQLSDVVRDAFVAWAGGLVGVILGDGIGTATAK